MDHNSIKALLRRLGSTLEAAELHGLLCGLLGSMPSTRAKSRWFREVLESTRMEAGELSDHAADLKALEQVFDAAVVDINAHDLSLQLVLPDEDESVSTRTDGLASWCAGFCCGVGLGTGWQSETQAEGAADSSLPDDTRELLRDFTAISRASTTDEEGDDVALVELEEYVRMGALLIFEELQPAPPSTPNTQSSIH